MVESRTPGHAEVLLGQPDVAQRLAAGAAHGGREGDGALQRAVLLAAASAGEDCGTKTGRCWSKGSGEPAVRSITHPVNPRGTGRRQNATEVDDDSFLKAAAASQSSPPQGDGWNGKVEPQRAFCVAALPALSSATNTPPICGALTVGYV